MKVALKEYGKLDDTIETDRTMRSGIQVIARAAAVLRALKDNPSGQSLGQIAQAVGLPRSTVQRIVQALEEERLVIMLGHGGGIRLGPELQALASAARYNIVERCRPLLHRLADTTGETVDLSLLRGWRMIFLDQVQGSHRLRAVSSVGEAFPVTSTANGRACLALLTDTQASKLAEEEWDHFSKPSDWPSLKGHLDAARSSGVAEDCEDHSEGICALGIAFNDPVNDLYAISVPIPVQRYTERRKQVAQSLAALKIELLRILGD